MKVKRILAVILTVAMLFTLPSSVFAYEDAPEYDDAYAIEETAELSADDAWTADTSWYSESESEFKISSVEELAGLAQLVNSGNTFAGKTVTLTNDIDLEGKEWTPIGNSSNAFKGTFDGGKHTVSNLVVTGNNSYVGFFGFASDGILKSVTINNAKVSGYLAVGALAGSPYTSEVSGINLTGLVEINGFAYVGGVLGRNVYNDVTDVVINASEGSYVKADSVDGEDAYRTYVGGVIGFMAEGKFDVTNVTSNIDVYGSTCDIGGMVGIAHYGNTYTNCLISGDVYVGDANENEYGGIAGVWHQEQPVTFNECYFTGDIYITDGNGGYTKVENPEAIGPSYSGGEDDKPVVNTKYVAKIGNTSYETLADAFADLESGNTIELIDNIELDNSIAISSDISFTIEGNGKTISLAEGSAETNSAFNFGNPGDDSTRNARTYNIKNIVFDGWTTDHVVRIEGATSLVEGCTFKNSNQPDGLGLLTSTYADVTVKDCIFKDNICVKCIDINSNADDNGSIADNVISNCTFVNNTCSNVGVVYYADGNSTTVSGCEFIGNSTNTSGSGATLYMGFNGGIKVNNNLFENNTVVSAGDGTNLAGGLFAGFADNNCNVSGNVFINNAASNAASSTVGQDATISSYYAPASVSGNYWNGGKAPVMGTHLFTKHEYEYSVAIDSYYATYTTDADGNVVCGDETTIVAEIDGIFYGSLTEAFNAAEAGDVIELRPDVTINEGTIKLPVNLTNVTLKGNGTAVIKDTTIMSSDGSSYQYSGFTVDGVIFDNSNVVITGWRTGVTVLENLTFKNNIFTNIVRTDSVAAVHINVDVDEPVRGFVFENNIIDGVTGSSNSGLYLAADGNIVIKDNVIKNVAFRPYVLQVTDDNGTDDRVIVTGNKFTDSSAGRLQAYGSDGTDNVELRVNENIITGTTNTQEICYWGFNEENTTFDFSRNYYEYDPITNFNKFYINSTASSYADIDKYNVLPYYTSLLDNGEIDPASLYDGITDGISVNFEKVDAECTEESFVYDIVLKSYTEQDEEFINRLNSLDLTFALTTTDDINYEIIASNSEITINPVNNSADRYEFHYSNKDNVTTDSGSKITIGRVKFTGYGKFSFNVDSNATTNAAHATTIDDNIVDTYIPKGDITKGEGVLHIDRGLDGVVIKVPTRNLTIKVSFPNTIDANPYAYQNMKVTVTGPSYENVIYLGNGDSVNETGDCAMLDDETEAVAFYKTIIADELVLNTPYTVTVEGAGYRMAKYTVSMTENKSLYFWNNVMDNAQAVEVSEFNVEKNAQKVTFLAGDIVKDNNINVYDLSAVVSYFGEIDLDENNKPGYAKYDLNRDGKIDSKDVAYVLVSWGN